MADQSITIKIADKTYPLRVNSPETEQCMRLAAERINSMLAVYNEKFPSSDLSDKLAFVALNESAAKFAAQHVAAVQKEEVATFEREMGVYLNKIESSR
ncbi:MAG: cell division protein ZapA [Bacteroidales bacterium]|nr:cell division protein ZapA [Bacteroidales bacterium]